MDPRSRSRRRLLGACLLLFTFGSAARAQVPDSSASGERILSMGQPPLYKWYAGAGAGAYRGDESLVTRGRAGVYHDLLNPMFSALGYDLAGYAGTRGDDLDGGVQALLLSPVLRLGVGLDYNLREQEVDALVSLVHPIRRGGVFVRGGTMRLDWLPGRGHSWNLSLTFPLAQPWIGRTRPRQDRYPLPEPVTRRPAAEAPTEVAATLSRVRDAAVWIGRLTTPFADQAKLGDFEGLLGDIEGRLGTPTPLIDGPHSSLDETRAYHVALERAFSVAATADPVPAGESTEIGREIAAIAREIVLEEVLLPYDRTLGRRKDPDTTLGLAEFARARFDERLRTSAVPPERLDTVEAAFDGLLAIVEDVRRSLQLEWKDPAYVWLPLQLALREEDHVSQTDLSNVLMRATGAEFTIGNRVWYVINEQFQIELGRTIREARQYHVLWIHDVRGVNDDGEPDRLALAHAYASYFYALTERVKEYDETGTLPVYILILDEWFYEANQSRDLLDLLENPLTARIDLPPPYERTQELMRAGQRDLRQAVAHSARLQADAARFGPGWLENRVKVQVNITNPADPTFWAGKMIPLVGLPDNVARDHRKLAFYDVTESDPYSGMAIYTGMGVGEHYAGANWEDRAILAQGPALVALKDAARELFLSQGFAASEVPYPLRPKPLAVDYEDRIQQARSDRSNPSFARVLEVHNQTGYGEKAVDVAKAVLYTLMPAGSVVKIPDSLWNSPVWGSMLMGLALRGGRVVVISPRLETAPSAGFPQMSRAQELMAKLVDFGQRLDDELADSGGYLRVGIYDPDVPVMDLTGRLRRTRQTFEQEEWLRDLYGFDADVYETMDALIEKYADRNWESELEIRPEEGRPKLHMKENLFLNGEAWDGLMARPEWAEILRVYIEQRAYRFEHHGEYVSYRAMADSLQTVVNPALAKFIEGLTAEERIRLAGYLVIGSHNQNLRSMVTDGEVSLVIAGVDALSGLIDLISITGLSVWVDDLEELQSLLPATGGWRKWFSRWIKDMV